jgi:hypothetical protein
MLEPAAMLFNVEARVFVPMRRPLLVDLISTGRCHDHPASSVASSTRADDLAGRPTTSRRPSPTAFNYGSYRSALTR